MLFEVVVLWSGCGQDYRVEVVTKGVVLADQGGHAVLFTDATERAAERARDALTRLIAEFGYGWFANLDLVVACVMADLDGETCKDLVAERYLPYSGETPWHPDQLSNPGRTFEFSTYSDEAVTEHVEEPVTLPGLDSPSTVESTWTGQGPTVTCPG